MSTIKVTASITCEYDTEEGLVTGVDGAVEDVKDLLDSGNVSSGQFEFKVKVLS